MDDLTLAEAPLDTPLTVHSVPEEHSRHLSRLGLRRGAAFTVLRRSTGGGRIVAVDGARVALGAAMLGGLRARVLR